jgi:Tol biopolymer transport system component
MPPRLDSALPMPLAAGQTLSFYEILGPLGAGAMGEVYRAKDTRLEREVAIKVLPEHFAEDEERLRRFEREAKTLASLNHPNVAGIHGIDQVEGTCFIAMELVPGEDLSERLKRGPLPIKEAIDVCQQIAEGLEAAHEAGVVHRDLKPANIRITPEGVVKVLDFGLAKPRSEKTSGSSVTAKPDSFLITEEGMVLGTPTYMSPEQARAKPVDRRTDVWAFGCVLYECLTGQRAFGGESVIDVLAAIVEHEPDWSALPSATPPHVRALLQRCLDKDPRKRLRDIGEARVLLEDPGADAAPAPASVPAASKPFASLVPLGIGIVLGLVIALLALRTLLAPPAPEPPDRRLSVHITPEEVFSATGCPNLAFSRDGSTLAWVGGADSRIYVRALDSYVTRALPETEGAISPFFSPDGRWIGFYQAGALMKVALTGGRPAQITEHAATTFGFRGGSWGDDGWIVFSPFVNLGLLRVHESGGEFEVVTDIESDPDVRTHRWPQIIPGTDVVIYTSDDTRSADYYDDASIVARALATGEESVVVEGASQARYAAGHLVFARSGNLFAQRFDPATLKTSGMPVMVLSGVETDSSSGAVQFALSADGSLAYAPGVTRERFFKLAWRDLDGTITPLDLPAAAYRYPRVSPDGKRVAYISLDPDASDLWVHDVERGTTSRQTHQLDAASPLWSADSSRIVFGSERKSSPGLFVLQVDAGLPPERIAPTDWGVTLPSAFTPGEAEVIAVRGERGSGLNLSRISMATGEITDVVATSFEERAGALHPDGEWLAYTSNHSGRFEIYLRRLDSGPILPVSTEGGLDPRWSADGSTLYYIARSTDELWAIDVTLSPNPTLSIPRLVLTSFFHQAGVAYNYDVAPDGRFLTLLDSAEQEAGREVRIHSGWVGEVTE